MAGLRTEFDFVLPKGYVDVDGRLHREGTMRLATARDEIEPLRDRSITDPDDPYLTVLVLSRVVTRLGSLDTIDNEVIEGLFAADLAFLQDLYGIVNFGDPADVAALQESVLPAEPTDTPADTPADPAEPMTSGDDAADDPDAGSSATSSRRSRIEEVSRSGTS